MPDKNLILTICIIILLGALVTVTIVMVDKKKEEESKKAKEISEEKSNTTPNTNTGSGSSTSTPTTTPTPSTKILTSNEVSKLVTDMYTFFGWFQNGTDRCYIVNAWLNLSDSNLRIVTDKYVIEYSTNPIQKINSAVYVCQNAPWSEDPDAILIKRLNNLGYY